MIRAGSRPCVNPGRDPSFWSARPPDRHRGRRIVALASGTRWSRASAALINVLGRDAVTVLPAVSSVALARARMRWPAETVAVLRDHRTIARELSPGRRILILSADRHTPAEVAATLTAAGFGASVMTVLADLGAPTESRETCLARDWAAGDEAPALHVLAVECGVDAGPDRGCPDGGPGNGGPDDGGLDDDNARTASSHPARPLGLAPGLPDDAFESDGQLTRRDLRASALSRLTPGYGQVLWDVGPVPARWGSSGCGPTRVAGRSRSRRTPPAPTGSCATPPAWGCPRSWSSGVARPRSWTAAPARTPCSSAVAAPPRVFSTCAGTRFGRAADWSRTPSPSRPSVCCWTPTPGWAAR